MTCRTCKKFFRLTHRWLCVLLCVLMTMTVAACNKTNEQDGTVTESQTESASKTESEGVSETVSETESESVSETSSETESETLSEEEKNRLADEAYLSTVTYLKFELTGKDEPYFVGRWFEKNLNGETHKVTTTDGSHLYFLVNGTTEINVNFTTNHRLKTPYFAYSIDGETPVRQLITDPTVTLPDNGRHTVRIVADGLTETEEKWAHERGFALKNITAGEGTVTGIKPTGKTIFFYGDSITEGIRALNMNADSDGNSATNAYTWYTAAALGATPYYVGYGASGLLAPGSFSTLFNAIERLSVNRTVDSSEIASITPDVIVINHGANDASQANIARFEAALRSVIARLQEKYPGVEIVYMVPFLSAEHSIAQQEGEIIKQVAAEIDGMHVVETADWDLTYTDGNLHPDVAGAKKAAEKLSAALTDIFGEDFFAA